MAVYRFALPSGPFKTYAYLSVPHCIGWTSSALQSHIANWLHKTMAELEWQVCADYALEPIVNTSTDRSERPAIQESGGFADTSQLTGMVYCRGGIRGVGTVRRDWMGDFQRLELTTIAPAYRAAEGSEGWDEFGGREVEDALAAYRLLGSFPWLRARPRVLMGFSRGSITATQAALRLPDLDALVLWGGVSNLLATYAERADLRSTLRRAVRATPSRQPDLYRRRSPLYLAHALRCPILVMHGTADAQVDFHHATQMAQALERSGQRVVTHFYQGMGHHLPRPIHEAVLERMRDELREFERLAPINHAHPHDPQNQQNPHDPLKQAGSRISSTYRSMSTRLPYRT
ncbi:MAG: prolyl oligopeptidase family serine peptidase [Alicyclobacillaceae bacterium]|nr:prolyl oligopeptidase family serine peptidase [Alicyclobacillaceae bacterium]